MNQEPGRKQSIIELTDRTPSPVIERKVRSFIPTTKGAGPARPTPPCALVLVEPQPPETREVVGVAPPIEADNSAPSVDPVEAAPTAAQPTPSVGTMAAPTAEEGFNLPVYEIPARWTAILLGASVLVGMLLALGPTPSQRHVMLGGITHTALRQPAPTAAVPANAARATTTAPPAAPNTRRAVTTSRSVAHTPPQKTSAAPPPARHAHTTPLCRDGSR